MVLTPSEINSKLERILPTVQKPARYIGGELNQVVKNWDSIETHIALVFPDIYDIGMSNLGLAILYELINDRPDALAERVYNPWIDMEAEIRQAGIPLYSLEIQASLSVHLILLDFHFLMKPSTPICSMRWIWQVSHY